jgi:hypothetical protein
MKFGIRRSFGHVDLRAGNTQFQLLESHEQGVMFLVAAVTGVEELRIKQI